MQTPVKAFRMTARFWKCLSPLEANFRINYGVANSGSTSHQPNLYHLSTRNNLFFWKSSSDGEGNVTEFDELPFVSKNYAFSMKKNYYILKLFSLAAYILYSIATWLWIRRWKRGWLKMLKNEIFVYFFGGPISKYLLKIYSDNIILNGLLSFLPAIGNIFYEEPLATTIYALHRGTITLI